MIYSIARMGFVGLALWANTASATELPERKAASVEPRRSCVAEGAGFFSIPGSETCIRMGGRVRAESRLQSPKRFGTQTGARVVLDARTRTEYGPLRVVIRYDARSTGK